MVFISTLVWHNTGLKRFDHKSLDKLEREENPRSANLLYKVIDSRTHKRSTALVTNVDFEMWDHHLTKGQFHCFACGAQGNQLDFWSQLHQMSIHEAALDLSRCIDIVRIGRRPGPRRIVG